MTGSEKPTNTDPAIILYSRPNCVQCVATERALASKALAYSKINIDEDQEAADMIRSTGLKTLPVVTYNGQMWSGFRPDLINKAYQELLG